MLWNTIAVNEKPNKSNVHEEDPINLEDYITEEDVKLVADISLGSNIQVIDCNTKRFSNKAIGFLAMHQYLNITIQRPDYSENEVYSYFLKAVPHQNELQASFIHEAKCFDKETNFYRYILPELLKNAEDKSFVARCFLIKKDALVFENLTVKNFHGRDLFLDVAALKSTLSTIAKLHATSILAENRLGKTFIDLYPDIFKEGVFVKTGKLFKWFVSRVNILRAVAKSLGLNDQCVPKICNRIFEFIVPSKTSQNVVCHGDLKVTNLMFDDSQPMPSCTLVDFQLVRYAPAMFDVAQFMYLNCRRELRKKLEQDLLQHYYETFSNVLQLENLQEKIPSYNNLLQQYQKFELVGIVTNALYVPFQYMDEQKFVEMTNDSDTFNKFMLEPQDEMVLKKIQENENYKDIYMEIILEMNERAAEFLKI